jgi:type II secretory pathway pseudopilin PulG
MLLDLNLYKMPSRRQNGFAYIALLAVIAILALGLGVASENLAQQAQREREAELLFVGDQFRNAIASYYHNSPQGIMQLPLTLDELLNDKRFPKPVRHLRRIYADPMSGVTKWGLVRNEQGRISGVFSLSTEAPIRTNPELEVVRDVEGKVIRTYSGWKFIFKPEDDNGLAASTTDEGEDNPENDGSEQSDEVDTSQPD